MYLKLTRLQQVGDATTGVLNLDGRPIAETMENSHTLIATGMYPVKLTMSPRFGMTLPLIYRVIKPWHSNEATMRLPIAATKMSC